jgi:Fibronectin type III domain.
MTEWILFYLISGPVTGLEVEGLIPNHKYKFRVRAVNKQGKSEPLTTTASIEAKNPFSKSFIILKINFNRNCFLQFQIIFTVRTPSISSKRKGILSRSILWLAHCLFYKKIRKTTSSTKWCGKPYWLFSKISKSIPGASPIIYWSLFFRPTRKTRHAWNQGLRHRLCWARMDSSRTKWRISYRWLHYREEREVQVCKSSVYVSWDKGRFWAHSFVPHDGL